jgi:hypothetical protein
VLFRCQQKSRALLRGTTLAKGVSLEAARRFEVPAYFKWTSLLATSLASSL